jgi:D-alanine transaminase
MGGIMMMFYKDRFIDKNEVHISPDDRGYYFGDGIYEVFRVYDGRIYEKEAHLQRLMRSAKEISITLPEPIDMIDKTIEKLLEIENFSDGTVYLQITRGEAPRVHSFPQPAPTPVMLAYCTEAKRPIASMQKGIAAMTMEDIRWLRCDIKALNLLPNVLAKQTALDRGFNEVILHRNGTVTECSSSNFMMIKEETLYTHPANNLILHGITRGVVLRLARTLGIEVKEEAFSLNELMRADEAFISGTNAEITPIIEIDGTRVNSGSPGAMTRQLQQAFEQSILMQSSTA